MHHCLTIPEVLGLIFEKVKKHGGEYPPWSDDEALETFASLALTCRAFQDPALDMLWSEQDTIRNVLKTLPSCLWVERKESGPSGWDVGFYFRIINTIEPEDWAVPLSYARRIRKLSLRYEHEEEFPDAAMFKAIASAPAEHFCPNLRSLVWASQEEAHLPFLNIFLGPNLESARIILDHFESSLPDNLSFRNLKNLEFHCKMPSSATCRAASDLLTRLERVENLVVPCLDRNAVKYLSHLPSLRSLELSSAAILPNGDTAATSSSEATPAHSPPFPALRNVKFDDRPLPGSIVECLQMLPVGCPIECFVTFVNEDAAEESFASLFTEVGTRFSSASLRTLEIKSRAQWVFNIDRLENPGALIPLLSFHNLTKLLLILPIAIGIDDAMAWDCATSWPSLVRLEMREPGAGLSRSPPCMTMNALRAFATHCRRLKHLSLNVDGSTIPSLDDDDSSESVASPRCTLSFLDVGSSPIHDAETVAKFLADLFPHLRNIYCQDWRWGGYTARQDEDGVRARLHYTRWKAVEVALESEDEEDEDEDDEDGSGGSLTGEEDGED
ncbi:hypothetical protein FB45DRAFT_894810 [Roridomyces roridus]|uniref:F-box domain-containing protein n=1 Tax=Roridomyces roridus TaxID=1738132 RepID=A0AAD7CGF5_9AGAR|nr:hypothetical protein FB45DRAFT_894810 [Roridomyces roridus]